MLKPIMDRILLRKIEEKQAGAIHIPDQYRESDKYEVVAVGDLVIIGGKEYPMDRFLKVGDIVLVGQYNVEACEAEGQKLFLSRVQDVRGKERANARAAA